MDKRHRIALFCAVAAVLAIAAVVFWQPMSMLVRFWRRPDYSHGYLVPFFSVFLLWVRRDMLATVQWHGTWWGAVLIGLSALLYVASGVLGIALISAFSLIPALVGMVLLLGGWPLLQWSWPALAFLVFMIPLPTFAESMATVPLRRVGTLASTYALQTMGLPAVAEGNVIMLSDYPIGVAEACSGLRMLMTSVALAFGFAFVMQRPLWERLVIVISAVPIALITNVIRITLTGLCYEYSGQELADTVFHTLAGWLMMPMAIGMLWLEMVILSRMLIEPQQGPSLSSALVAK